MCLLRHTAKVGFSSLVISWNIFLSLPFRWHRQFDLDSQLPFLCGDSEECRTLGHPQAVARTIANIEHSFLVVGVLEQLEKTVTVLECLMPSTMKGLVEAYRNSNVHR